MKTISHLTDFSPKKRKQIIDWAKKYFNLSRQEIRKRNFNIITEHLNGKEYLNAVKCNGVVLMP